MSSEEPTQGVSSSITELLHAARRSLGAGDAPAAAQAASRCWELISQAPEPLPADFVVQVRRLVEDCLRSAEDLRGQLSRQLDTTAASRRALDAYAAPDRN